MKYEDIFEYIGQIGVYQWCVFALNCAFILNTADPTHMVFVGGDMDHWCKVPELSNLSVDVQKHLAIPRLGPNDTGPYSSCRMFAIDWSVENETRTRNWNRPDVPCKEWSYDRTVFESTIVSKFDLVCEFEHLNRIITSIHMFGVFLGALTAGPVSDRIGRKKTIVAFSMSEMVATVLTTWSPNYATFAVSRFFIGYCSSGRGLAMFVNTMELIGPKYRTVVAIVIQLSWSFGVMFQPLLAYFLRDELRYLLAATAPKYLMCALTWFLLESPRWLIVHSKYSEAKLVLDRICNMNGTRLPDNIEKLLETMDKDKSKYKLNCLGLVKTRVIRLRTVIMDFSWLTCSLIYYALTLNIGTLSGNIYINLFISGAVEVPANIVCFLLARWPRTGRRLTGCLSLIGAGLASFLCIPFIIYKHDVMATTLAMAGKLFISMAYSLVYLFAAEIFPTEVRNIGMSSASMSARIGAIVSPQLGRPLMKLWQPLPSLVFGVFATLSGLSYLLLPETLGRALPNTVQQAEEIPAVTWCTNRRTTVNPSKESIEDCSSERDQGK